MGVEPGIVGGAGVADGSFEERLRGAGFEPFEAAVPATVPYDGEEFAPVANLDPHAYMRGRFPVGGVRAGVEEDVAEVFAGA